jgi:hypothetical protein
MSRAIGNNIIMTAISSSSHSGAHFLGCSINIYNKKALTERNKPTRTLPHNFIRATTHQWPLSSVIVHSVHGKTSRPLDGSPEGVKTRAKAVCTGLISITKSAKYNHENTQYHSTSPIIIESSSDSLSETHQPIPAHSRDSLQVPT